MCQLQLFPNEPTVPTFEGFEWALEVHVSKFGFVPEECVYINQELKRLGSPSRVFEHYHVCVFYFSEQSQLWEFLDILREFKDYVYDFLGSARCFCDGGWVKDYALD